MKIVMKKKGLKMLCSPYYIPKGIKGKPLGEDAHFVRPEEETMGVADGVGGWAKKGIDSGVFARALMTNSDRAVSRQKNSDPKKILEEGFSKMGKNIKGASTACIVTHRNGSLRSANIGDSGYVVLRDGQAIHRSRTQQHRFNCPYQLSHCPTSDRPDMAAENQLAVAEGDLIVLCTDGVLDNLFDSDFNAILAQHKAPPEPKDLARSIAEEAYYKSLDKYFVSPFAIGSAIHGHHHKGGKQDDITVVVGKIIAHYDISLRS